MKKYEIYIMEIILFISIIMFNIVYKSALLQNITIILLAIYSVVRFGLMKDNNYIKNTATKIVISSLLIYFITTYILGLVLGFNKTPLAFSLEYLLRVILLEALIIILKEIVRYIIARHKKLPIIIYTLLLAILDIIIEIKGYNLNNLEAIFIFTTTIIVPVLCKHTLCSYITYKISYIPSIIYNLTISLYQYILPIIPNLGNYLYATTNTVLPFIVYYSISRISHYKDKIDVYKNKLIRRFIYAPILATLVVIILLASGLLSHTIIAIGSNSMSPSYNKGDAVIYKKTPIEKIKIGEIIAFKKNGKIITHRIINISNNYEITTKGDANNAPDTWIVEKQEILGVVKYTIKYIGYPTIWLNEAYNRKD